MFSKQYDLLNNYDCEKQILLVSIYSREITEFNTYYQYLIKRIDELNDKDLKENFDETLKRLFSNIKFTLDSYETVLADFDLNKLGLFFTSIQNKDPDNKTTDVLRKLADLIKLFKSGDVKNKMYEKYEEFKNSDKNDSIIIKKYIFGRSVFPYQLATKYYKSDTFYKQVFFLGSPNIYGKQTIFKAQQTYYLGYDIHPMNFSQTPIVKGNSKKNSAIYEGLKISKVADENNSDGIFYSEDIYNPIQMNINMKDIKKNYVTDSTEEKLTEAKLVLLNSGNHIFYTTSSKVNILDETTGTLTRNQLNDDMEGNWVVIRMASDEDYKISESKKIIGKSYDLKMSEVTKYKELLKNKFQGNTLDSIRLSFKKIDVEASNMLIKNWVFGDTIAPAEVTYRKILKYLDYKDSEINLLVEYYKEIRRARSVAGRKLNKHIQSSINNIGLERISDGIVHENYFEFTDDLGQFRVEVINDIDQEITEIETNHLYKLKRQFNDEYLNASNEYFD